MRIPWVRLLRTPLTVRSSGRWRSKKAIVAGEHLQYFLPVHIENPRDAIEE